MIDNFHNYVVNHINFINYIIAVSLLSSQKKQTQERGRCDPANKCGRVAYSCLQKVGGFGDHRDLLPIQKAQQPTSQSKYWLFLKSSFVLFHTQCLIPFVKAASIVAHLTNICFYVFQNCSKYGSSTTKFYLKILKSCS